MVGFGGETVPTDNQHTLVDPHQSDVCDGCSRWFNLDLHSSRIVSKRVRRIPVNFNPVSHLELVVVRDPDGPKAPGELLDLLIHRSITYRRMAKIGLRMYYYRLITSDYTEAYRQLTGYVVKHHGPRIAVGGDELGIGRLQF